MKMYKTLLFSMVMLSTFLAACSGESSSSNSETSSDGNEQSDDKQVLNISESSEIPTMDPSMATDVVAFQWLAATTDGLYRFGKNAEIEPGIAKSHEVSEDGTTWTFKLREAKWSNGDPVTAHDFVYSWRRAVNPEVGSEYGPYMFNGVVKNAEAVSTGEMPVEKLGVKAIDDTTLEVQLEKPIPYFKELTTFTTFLPLNQEFVEKHGENFALSADALLANGPFKFTEWKAGEGWVLEKNENYWDKENVKLDKINVKVVKEIATSVNLYESGDLDRTSLTAEFVDKYSSSPEFSTIRKPSLLYIKMNQENEILSNKNARKAIQRIINKENVANVILNNGATPIGGTMPAEFVSHPESGKDFREINGNLAPYNPEKAKEFWQKAKEELGVEEVELNLLGDDMGVAKKMTAYFKGQLEQLEGLTINVQSVPFKERLRRNSEMEYELQNYVWLPDYLDANTFMNLWVTDGANNKTGYASEEYDKLIERANNELAQKPAERFEAFLQAEKLLIKEDAVIAPIYQKGSAKLQKPYIKGTFRNPMGSGYIYKYAYIEGK